MVPFEFPVESDLGMHMLELPETRERTGGYSLPLHTGQESSAFSWARLELLNSQDAGTDLIEGKN